MTIIYYLLRQPDKLESLALEKLAVWIAIQAKKLMLPIWELQQRNATSADAALSRHIETIRNCLECNMPRALHDMLLSKTITELYNLLVNTDLNILARMVETLFTKKLTSLSVDFKQFKMFRESLCSKSHLLTGLTHLDLNIDRSDFARCYSGDIENDIIQLLQELHSLKYLFIETVCTDKVLRCVVENCISVEELFLDLFPISPKAMNMLTLLHNLRTVAFRNPAPPKSIIKLLRSCENIEHIYTYGNDNRLWQVFKQFSCSKNTAKKKFNLKSYKCCSNTLEQLQVIFRMCPLIQKLTLHALRISQNNLTAITGLRDLRELILDGYAFYSDHIKEALQVVGCNLERLHLHSVAQIDLNAMIEISQTCPDLHSLSVEFCTFVDHSNRAYRENLVNPPFRNVKRLTLDIENCLYVQDIPLDLTLRTSPELRLVHEPALFLLANVLNVEFIVFTGTTMLTEDVMLSILDKNPLTRLKELRIEQSESTPRSMTSLTAVVLERLVRHCADRPQVTQAMGGPLQRRRINDSQSFDIFNYFY